MSGHSKWAQIKHKKGATDAKRGQQFSKLVREIMVAARIGGPNPDANPRLRAAMDRSREIGLPKDNIERAIARATGNDEDTKLEEFLYEATSPGGILILIEGITDSKNRTLAELKKILTDGGAKLAEPGSVSWNFEKIGTIEVRQETNAAIRPEEIENAIINSGAEDFTGTDSSWFIETKFTDRESVRKNLEHAGIGVSESGHTFKPKSTSAPDESAHKQLEKILDTVLSHDDVQEVYTNSALQ